MTASSPPPRIQSILHDPAEAGVREFPSESVRELERAARHLHYPFAHVDLGNARDKDDLLGALALALRLPDWFGFNWDALADCLCDLSWKPAPGYVIFIEGHDALRRACPAEIDTLVEILADAAEYWRNQEIPFWSFFSAASDGKRFLTPFPG